MRESCKRTSGFYDAAVENKGILLIFVLLGVFVFAVAFAGLQDKDLEEDSSWTSIRTRVESLGTRCLMVSDEDELGLLSKARPWKAKPLSAVTQTRDGFVVNKLCFVRSFGEGLGLDNGLSVGVAIRGNGSNFLPLRHMLSKSTASLRATATMAVRFLPRLPPWAASLRPQQRNSESGPATRMYCADCTSKLRR